MPVNLCHWPEIPRTLDQKTRPRPLPITNLPIVKKDLYENARPCYKTPFVGIPPIPLRGPPLLIRMNLSRGIHMTKGVNHAVFLPIRGKRNWWNIENNMYRSGNTIRKPPFWTFSKANPPCGRRKMAITPPRVTRYLVCDLVPCATTRVVVTATPPRHPRILLLRFPPIGVPSNIFNTRPNTILRTTNLARSCWMCRKFLRRSNCLATFTVPGVPIVDRRPNP
mmetsp:Transcript_17433/g.36112  ORF Transcript_17433/g.36112 Transcript_17433/m.36112 type:complete len:223 (+) Transcript_17433:138-806(+)